MLPRWWAYFAHAVFAVLLTLSAVNLTVPGMIARTVAESTPETDDDEDLEAEVAVSEFSRHAPTQDRTSTRLALPFSSIPTPVNSPVRPPSSVRSASADPLGARLRC